MIFPLKTDIITEKKYINTILFQDAIELAYEQTGIMAQAIEKDYYVTMLLRLLSEKMPYIVFKGGTSLSKCHKVIKRFSEDIDITIDTQISQGKKKKIKQAIVSSADELGINDSLLIGNPYIFYR